MFWSTGDTAPHLDKCIGTTAPAGFIRTTPPLFPKSGVFGHYVYSTYYYTTCLWLIALSLVSAAVLFRHHVWFGPRGYTRAEPATAAAVFCAGGWLTASFVELQTTSKLLLASTRHPEISGYGPANPEEYAMALDNAPGWPQKGDRLGNHCTLKTDYPLVTKQGDPLLCRGSDRYSRRVLRARGVNHLREVNLQAIYGGWIKDPDLYRTFQAGRRVRPKPPTTYKTVFVNEYLGNTVDWYAMRRRSWEAPGTGMNLLNWGQLIEAHYTCLRECSASRVSPGSTSFVWKSTPPALLLQRAALHPSIGLRKFARITPVSAEQCNFCRNRTPAGGGIVHDAVVALGSAPEPTRYPAWIHPGGGCSQCYYQSKQCLGYLLRRTFHEWQRIRLKRATLLTTKGLLTSKSPKMFYYLTTGGRNRVYRKGYTNSDVFPIPSKNQFVLRTHKLGTTKTRYRHKRIHTFSTWTRLDSLDHDIAKRKAIKQKKKGYPRYAIGTGCSVRWSGWENWSLGLRQALQNHPRNRSPLFTGRIDHLVSPNAHVRYEEGRPNGKGGFRNKFAFTINLENAKPYKTRVLANQSTTHGPQNRRKVYRSTLLWEYIHNHYNRRIINASKSGWLAYKYRAPELVRNKHYTPKKLSQFLTQRYNATRLLETTNRAERWDWNKLDWIPRYDVRPPYCPCKACTGVHTTPPHPDTVSYHAPRSHQRRLYFSSLRDKHRVHLLNWRDLKEYVGCTLTNPSILPITMREQGIRRASDLGYTPKTIHAWNYLFSISELPMGGKGFLWTRVYEYYFSQYTHNRQLQRWKWAKHEIGNENSRFVMYHEVPSYNHGGVKQWDKFSKFSIQPVKLSSGFADKKNQPRAIKYTNNFFKDYERVMLGTRGDKRRGFKRYANRRLSHIYMIHRYSKQGHVELFNKLWSRWEPWVKWVGVHHWSTKPSNPVGWLRYTRPELQTPTYGNINRPLNNFPIKELFFQAPDYRYVRQNLGWIKSGRSKTAFAAYYAHHHKFYHVVGVDRPLVYTQVQRRYNPVHYWLPPELPPQHARTVVPGPKNFNPSVVARVRYAVIDAFFAASEHYPFLQQLGRFMVRGVLAHSPRHWSTLERTNFDHAVNYWQYWLFDINLQLMLEKYRLWAWPVHKLVASYLTPTVIHLFKTFCWPLRTASEGGWLGGLCSTTLHIHPLRPIKLPKITLYWVVPLLKLWAVTKLWGILLRWLIPLDRSLFIKYRFIWKRKKYLPLMEWCMVKVGNNTSFMYYSRFILPALEEPNPYWSTQVVWFGTWVDYKAIHNQFTPKRVDWWELPTKPKHMTMEFTPTDREVAERYEGYREYKRSLWERIDPWPVPQRRLWVRYTEAHAIVFKGINNLRYWSRSFNFDVEDINMPEHFEKVMSWDDQEIHFRFDSNVRRADAGVVDYPRARPNHLSTMK